MQVTRLGIATAAGALALTVGALGALATGCAGVNDSVPAAVAASAPPVVSTVTAPRSVILLIGDGMGPQQVGLLMDWADAADAGVTNWERLTQSGTLGLLRTGAEGAPLTDSASSATALASGVSVPNGFIGTDGAGRPTRTCLEDARDSGRATGLVTTTRLTHATPAAFASHVPRREMEQQIGTQLLAAGVDVLLGGGAHFIDADLAAATGYHVVRTEAELASVPPGTSALLGVFAESHIPYSIDRDAPGEARAPSLAGMTRAALDVLSRDPDGFFLMVEGGRIDHGGHLNDVAAVLGEMREFDETIGLVRDFQEAHPDTLVIVTADHETGGLSPTVGAQPLLPRHYLDMATTASSLEAQAPPPAEREPVDPAVFGVGRQNFYPRYSWWEASRALERDARWNVSFATQGHTTTPVTISSLGPGSERFVGVHANEAVGIALREWMAVSGGAN